MVGEEKGSEAEIFREASGGEHVPDRIFPRIDRKDLEREVDPLPARFHPGGHRPGHSLRPPRELPMSNLVIVVVCRSNEAL
jgi:hypothetical protein